MFAQCYVAIEAWKLFMFATSAHEHIHHRWIEFSLSADTPYQLFTHILCIASIDFHTVSTYDFIYE